MIRIFTGIELRYCLVACAAPLLFGALRPAELIAQGVTDPQCFGFDPFWMQLRASAIDAFPQPQAFMDSPSNEDTCPASFLIPVVPG